MKRLPLIIMLTLALAAHAEEEDMPSPLSVGIEGGLAQPGGGFGGDHDAGRLMGFRIKYDAGTRWSTGAHFHRRVFRRDDGGAQRVTSQALAAAGYWYLREPSWWTPYLSGEAGIVNNRRAATAATASSQGTVHGLGVGLELNFLDLNSLSLEAARRTMTKVSVGGHGVSETAFTLFLNVYLPDRWIPLKPKKPLNLTEIEEAPATTVSSRQVARSQAQNELTQVIADIESGKTAPIAFEPGQAVLTAEAREPLDIIGTLMRRYPGLPLRIVGHTDEMSTPQDNDFLGLARAQTVRSYLVDNFALAADKVTAESAGAAQPAVDDTYEKGQGANRRIEFIVLP
jgi:outer membrane protein OmpA-like peptidoglycan-associated protein